MRFGQVIQGSFGGAYLGIIVTHVPGILGLAWRPTQNVELLASIVGLVLAAVVCIREPRRKEAGRIGIESLQLNVDKNSCPDR